jgi:hypothetical protein
MYEDKEESTSGKKLTSLSASFSETKRALNDITNTTQLANSQLSSSTIQKKVFD